MISMADLQALFAKVEGTTAAVDLLKVGQSLGGNTSGNGNNGHAASKSKPNNHKFRLALDIENCLDRFYGGYYSDWACGGQWNRAYQFVQLLVNAFDVANIEVIVFFDGSLHDRRRGQLADAKETRQKTISVLKHIRMIGTPPPKIWWLPPSGIRTCLRNALRSLGVQVVQTVNDHTRELIDYYREHKLHGIVGLHPDYIVAQPQHYYSSHDLRLSYKGTLETKEYLVAKLLAHLEVTRAQLPFVAAFLCVGADKSMANGVYKAIGVEVATDFETRMAAVARVVVAAPTGQGIAAFVEHLRLTEWAQPIGEAIEYYQKRERLVKQGGKQQPQQQTKGSRPKRNKAKGAAATAAAATAAAAAAASDKSDATQATAADAGNDNAEQNVENSNGEVSPSSEAAAAVAVAAAAAAADDVALASEASDQDDEFQRKLECEVNNLVEDLDFVPPSSFDDDETADYADMFDNMTLKDDAGEGTAATATAAAAAAAAGDVAASAAAVVAPMSADVVAVTATNKSEPKSTGTAAGRNQKASGTKAEKPEKAFVYTLPSDVIKTAFNRHQRGMMDARLYQILTKKEIILPQALEDEQYRDVPSVHLFYRPARQMIYAILFNLNHQRYIHSKHPNASNNGSTNKNSTATSANAAVEAGANTAKSAALAAVSATPPQVPTGNNAAVTVNNSTGASTTSPKTNASASLNAPVTIAVNEWMWSPQNEFKRPDVVLAQPLCWAVPTIQRLWFGTLFEDKQRRMRAFLSVMRSDVPLMLNRDYVPQHMLAMACVLRYIVTHPDRTILSRQELDAFLATAFSPHIVNIDYTQELVLPCVYLRGVYLGTLFMQGVETASMANDACGVPLPWTMCNPWLFFDGKLFHLKLKTASCVQSLRELCDDHIDTVLKIERFRKAILEDVEHYLLPSILAGNNASGNAKSQYFNAAGLSQLTGNNGYFGGGGNLHGAAPLPNQHLSSLERRRSVQQQLVRQLRQQQRNSDEYHLKVGGVVVGSWAGDLTGRKPYNNGSIGTAGGPLHASQRHHQQQQHHHQQQQQQQSQQQQQQHQAMHSRSNYAAFTNAGGDSYHQAPNCHHQHQQQHHHQHHHQLPHHHHQSALPPHQHHQHAATLPPHHAHHQHHHPQHHHHHHQHHQPHQQHHRIRGTGLSASVFYNNAANRKRRGPGGYMNGGAAGHNGHCHGGIAGNGGGGIVHRAIGRKYAQQSTVGGGVSAESKLAKNKARKQRAKSNKSAPVVAAATGTPVTTTTTTTADDAAVTSAAEITTNSVADSNASAAVVAAAAAALDVSPSPDDSPSAVNVEPAANATPSTSSSSSTVDAAAETLQTTTTTTN